MPKFRDLGINAIPLTIRPPEIGYAAASGNTTECPAQTTCHPPPHEVTTCPGDTTCPPGRPGDTTECRAHATCRPDDDIKTQCTPQAATCGGYGKNTEGSFTPDAVAQLRQQLEGHIGSSIHI